MFHFLLLYLPVAIVVSLISELPSIRNVGSVQYLLGFFVGLVGGLLSNRLKGETK